MANKGINMGLIPEELEKLEGVVRAYLIQFQRASVNDNEEDRMAMLRLLWAYHELLEEIEKLVEKYQL